MASPHVWKFHRIAGLDQVALETADDLLNLASLDPKLWVALSCPVSGLELDEHTLKLIDADGDDRIRVPELIAAVNWAAARLKNPADILKGAAALPLSAIDDSGSEGRLVLESARQVLLTLGKSDAQQITPEDTADTARIFSASPLNGDGIIPPEASEDPALQALIKDIIACMGGESDRNGLSGATGEKIDAFFKELAAYAEWIDKSAGKDIAILGEATDAAVAAIRAVRDKVDDYFSRCRLAEFDERAIAALNRSEDEYLAIAAKDMKLSAEEVAGFPLARIEAGKRLPLLETVNPAWAAALATLHKTAVAPVFGAARTSLSQAEWADLNERFAAYETWLGNKAGSAVERLGLARVKEILAGSEREKLAALVAQDKELEPRYRAISDVDRLTHYHRDLGVLLRNFVNFIDFYSPDRWAVFQAGTLYLDSRSTELCLRMSAPNPLAAMSRAYIAYLDCRRAGGETMKIAACVTQGDSDYLFVGRNGVFFDRKGRDWDATITSLVDNPISIRQAFWSPYKKAVRFLEEQIAKRAAAADTTAGSKLTGVAEQAVAANKAKAPEPKRFDLALVTGIGVALGSIGTFLATMFSKFVDVPAWQLPLILVGLMLVISLPAMIIAALKLRQRTLAPILEATGWAINGRVKINIPFGTKLTEIAELPPGRRVLRDDPYSTVSPARRWTTRIALVILLLALAAVLIRLDHNRRGHYFWQPAPATPEAMAETPRRTG